ncbi:MAG: zinc-binding alcohol dehydrogenase [Phycisphaerae bacterium]|nr:zinc-binding alcohol dehydrogenase [Phycisphaerae bacterium]
MQELVFLPGGQVEWQNGADPEVFPAAVEVETRVAAVSTGTELSGLRGMKQKTAGNYKPGYSIAGVIRGCGPEAAAKGNFSPGQRVAVYGAPYTYHKTRVAAPWTLVHPIPGNVSDEEASFCGLAAISMHGLRRGNFTAGERVAILGMGILGQLAEQMLRAWGCRTMAVDRHTEHLDLASKLGCGCVFDARNGDMVEAARAVAPAGVDGVVVNTGTAGRIIDDAADMCRDRGRLVLVGGDERVDVSRAKIFRKEIDLLISRAGGPGRYDAQYEKQGQDISPAWVRWTEGRNVAEFLEMVRLGRINVKGLITHRYPRTDAAKAYALLDSPNRYATMGVVFVF